MPTLLHLPAPRALGLLLFLLLRLQQRRQYLPVPCYLAPGASCLSGVRSLFPSGLGAPPTGLGGSFVFAPAASPFANPGALVPPGRLVQVDERASGSS